MPVAELKVEKMLKAFAEAIENHDYLEIDGVPEEGPPSIKVLNHDKKSAYSVSVEAILEQPLEAIIEALETGVRMKLYSISRVVGYWSRINNWNSSKKSELVDRIKGRAQGGYYVGGEHKPQGIEEAITTAERLPR